MLGGRCPGAGAVSTTSYQGVLKDDLGDNVTDGDYDFNIALNDVSTGGSALWTGGADVVGY